MATSNNVTGSYCLSK